eukprot:gene27014-24505_t
MARRPKGVGELTQLGAHPSVRNPLSAPSPSFRSAASAHASPTEASLVQHKADRGSRAASARSGHGRAGPAGASPRLYSMRVPEIAAGPAYSPEHSPTYAGVAPPPRRRTRRPWRQRRSTEVTMSWVPPGEHTELTERLQTELLTECDGVSPALSPLVAPRAAAGASVHGSRIEKWWPSVCALYVLAMCIQTTLRIGFDIPQTVGEGLVDILLSLVWWAEIALRIYRPKEREGVIDSSSSSARAANRLVFLVYQQPQFTRLLDPLHLPPLVARIAKALYLLITWCHYTACVLMAVLMYEGPDRVTEW